MAKKQSHNNTGRYVRSRTRRTAKTPFGTLKLARDNQRRFNAAVIELHRTTEALTRKDIGDWRRAWQMALNVDNPDRSRLYDIYRDTDADNHLTGCALQRRGFVKARPFKIVNAKGEHDTEAQHYFDQKWFRDLVDYALESVFWGHSLIELGEVTTDGDGCKCYYEVKLIPRKHVVPEYHRVVTNVGDDWRDGTDWREPAHSSIYIEAGRADDLGLYLKAAQQTIPKKNALAFWDGFAEIFGMPMRVAKTATRDPQEWRRLESMMLDAANNLSMVTGIETEIQFVESGKGDAFNVYDKRVDRANSELSKLTIGQTMTIEDGSSLSQSETHLEVFENLVEDDCRLIRDIVNNQLIPRMVLHGFPVKGCRFEWDDAVDYTPEQQTAYETMIADRYDVEPEYFAQKYNMPVGARRDLTGGLPPLHEEDGTEKPEKKQQKNAAGFFD